MKACAHPPLLSHQESEKLWLKKKKGSQQVPEAQQLKQKWNLQILVTIFKEMWALRNLICSRAKYLCLKRSNKFHPKNQSVSREQPWSCPAVSQVNPTRCGLLRPSDPYPCFIYSRDLPMGPSKNPSSVWAAPIPVVSLALHCGVGACGVIATVIGCSHSNLSCNQLPPWLQRETKERWGRNSFIWK